MIRPFLVRVSTLILLRATSARAEPVNGSIEDSLLNLDSVQFSSQLQPSPAP